MERQLSDLLADGERAVFHGPPAGAVAVLESAVTLAQGAGEQGELATAGWLLGVALGASGRFGAALAVLAPLLNAGEAPGAVASARQTGALAAAVAASVHRQLGRHLAAREVDQRGLAISHGSAEAAFDCLLGLAADALGLGEAAEARTKLTAAAETVPDAVEVWWRQRVRLDWIRAELALDEGRPSAAVEAAEAAVERAERAAAPRHVAKGLLLLGIAQVQAGMGDPPGTLRRAATLAEGLGTVPLVWRARALLAALVGAADPPESAHSLVVARDAVRALADDLPVTVREEWLARPDVSALVV